MEKIRAAMRRASIIGRRDSELLNVVFLSLVRASPLDAISLEEGIASGLVVLDEHRSGERVNTVTVVNKSSKYLFLCEGQTLRGAMQNRALNLSILVKADTSLDIPVTCVEQGRWARSSGAFESGDMGMPPSIRAGMIEDVTDAMKTGRPPQANQGAVWRKISRALGDMGAPSATHDLMKVGGQADEKLQAMLGRQEAPADATGAAFGLHGTVLGCDFMPTPALFHVLYDQLARSYAAEALRQTKRSSDKDQETVESFMASAMHMEWTVCDGIGEGEHVRGESANLIGSALFLGEALIHMGIVRKHADQA